MLEVIYKTATCKLVPQPPNWQKKREKKRKSKVLERLEFVHHQQNWLLTAIPLTIDLLLFQKKRSSSVIILPCSSPNTNLCLLLNLSKRKSTSKQPQYSLEFARNLVRSFNILVSVTLFQLSSWRIQLVTEEESYLWLSHYCCLWQSYIQAFAFQFWSPYIWTDCCFWCSLLHHSWIQDTDLEVHLFWRVEREQNHNLLFHSQ